jgi:hypothetical protein
VHWNSGGSVVDSLSPEAVATSNCDGAINCLPGENYNKAACDAYMVCFESMKTFEQKRRIYGGDPLPPMPIAVGNTDENPNCPKECPSSPTGNHVWQPDEPPLYTYDIEDDGTCTRTKVIHCRHCGTTYSNASTPQVVTWEQMLGEYQVYAALTDQAATTMAGHLRSVIDRAQKYGTRLGHSKPCTSK